jgi:hypothetical protein
VNRRGMVIMIANDEIEFVKELNKLVAKYGMAIECEGDSFILEVEGELGSEVFFSRFYGRYLLVNKNK